MDWGDGILKTEESPTVRSWDTPGVKTFRVRAIDDCGESPWVTLTINVLDKPTLSNITLTSTRACSEVALSWNNNGAEMYQVFRKQGAGTYVVVASPNTGTTFTDTNVIEGQSYTYKIVSYL